MSGEAVEAIKELTAEVSRLCRAVEAGVGLQALRDRHWSYLKTQEIEPNAVLTLRTSIAEYLEGEEREKLDGFSDPDLERLLVAERIYVHQFSLFLTQATIGGVAPHFKIELATWVREASDRPDWLMTHTRQARYYIGTGFPTQLNRWMVDDALRALDRIDEQDPGAGERGDAAQRKLAVALRQEAENWFYALSSAAGDERKLELVRRALGETASEVLVNESVFIEAMVEERETLLSHLTQEPE